LNTYTLQTAIKLKKDDVDKNAWLRVAPAHSQAFVLFSKDESQGFALVLFLFLQFYKEKNITAYA